MFDNASAGISCNLQQIRKSQKISQEDLASRLNIARKTLSFYETGKRFPSIDEAFKIAEILGVEFNQIWSVRGGFDRDRRSQFYVVQSTCVLMMAKSIDDPAERRHAELIAQDWLNLAQSITGRPSRA